MRIRDKITIPFIILAFAGIAATALLSVNLISGVLEQRFERQLIVASELLTQANFARNPLILERVKAIIDADVLTFEGGEAVASTFNTAVELEWVTLLEKQGRSGSGAVLEAPVLRHVEFRGGPYTLAFRPLLHGSDAVPVIL